MSNDDGQERPGKRRRVTRRTIMRAAAVAPTLGNVHREAFRDGAPDPDAIEPDVEVIMLCMFARQVDQYVTAEAVARWDAMLYRIGELQARKQSALLAKARLLRTLSPDGDGDGTKRRRRRPSPEEALLASLLRDLLAADPSESIIADIERRDKAERC